MKNQIDKIYIPKIDSRSNKIVGIVRYICESNMRINSLKHEQYDIMLKDSNLYIKPKFAVLDADVKKIFKDTPLSRKALLAML
jgi:hypothetical protein